MDAIDNPQVVEFRKALETWTDERMVSSEDIWNLAMFNVYLVNLAEADGWVYDGHSLKYDQTSSTLVVRGTIDGIPHVVFSSGRTPIGCVRAFLRKMGEGWLEWQKDKFR